MADWFKKMKTSVEEKNKQFMQGHADLISSVKTNLEAKKVQAQALIQQKKAEFAALGDKKPAEVTPPIQAQVSSSPVAAPVLSAEDEAQVQQLATNYDILQKKLALIDPKNNPIKAVDEIQKRLNVLNAVLKIMGE